MKKCLILYHSGVGNTKFIAEQLEIMFCQKGIATMLKSIEDKANWAGLETYDFVLIGFPVYHGEPSRSIINFVRNLKYQNDKIYIYSYCTCGLYPANAFRILANELSMKNIYLRNYKWFRGPATDGVILFSRLQFLQSFSRNLKKRMDSLVTAVLENQANREGDMPRYKLYGLLNEINREMGKRIRPKFYIHRSRCILCKKCIWQCPYGCFKMENNQLVHQPLQCEYCYRCIHHCEKQAISIYGKSVIKIQFNNSFYQEKKNYDGI